MQIHRDITYPIWWFCFEIKVIHLWLHLEPKPKCFSMREKWLLAWLFLLAYKWIRHDNGWEKVIVLPCSISWVEYKMSHSRMPTHCTLHAFSPQECNYGLRLKGRAHQQWCRSAAHNHQTIIFILSGVAYNYWRPTQMITNWPKCSNLCCRTKSRQRKKEKNESFHFIHEKIGDGWFFTVSRSSL